MSWYLQTYFTGFATKDFMSSFESQIGPILHQFGDYDLVCSLSALINDSWSGKLDHLSEIKGVILIERSHVHPDYCDDFIPDIKFHRIWSLHGHLMLTSS